MLKTNNRRFYSLNDYFKDTFKEKVFKVSLDGGFTCPNRDGKVAYGGCIFCSDSGSGDFAGSRRKSITEQIDEQLEFLKNKIKNRKVIAYFQNFTNTYGDVEYLKNIYFEALNHPKVLGLAIGTRPDCIDNKVLSLLEEINKTHFLWLELGLQTADDKIAKFVNRGYELTVYLEVAKKLKNSNIKFIAHMIIGLPKEEREGILKTADCIVQSGAWGIKIHSLHIIKGTRLEKLYNKIKFKIFTLEEYVEMVVTILKSLPEKMVVHRVTGDGKKEEVLEPEWSLNKRKVLNEIEKELKKRDNM